MHGHYDKVSLQFLTSPKNPRVQNACSLRDSKHRRQSGRFLIDGSKLCQQAIESGRIIDEVFILEGSPSTKLIDKLANGNIPTECFVVNETIMSKLHYGEQSHDVVAVARSWALSLDAFDAATRNSKKEHSRGIYLVLDRMEKPGNLGAALRTADGVGVDGVFLCDPICDVFNPNVIRSSLGAVFFVPLAVGSFAELTSWFCRESIGVFTARVEGSKPYASVVYPANTAIVIGNEAAGLEDRWPISQFPSVSIPMAGIVDSLNASVSTAVLLFEIARQRVTKT